MRYLGWKMKQEEMWFSKHLKWLKGTGGGTYLDTKILLSFPLFVHKILIHSHSEVFSNSSGNVRETATLKQENLCKLHLNHLCFSQRFRFPSEIRTEFPWSFSALIQQTPFLLIIMFYGLLSKICCLSMEVHLRGNEYSSSPRTES